MKSNLLDKNHVFDQLSQLATRVDDEISRVRNNIYYSQPPDVINYRNLPPEENLFKHAGPVYALKDELSNIYHNTMLSVEVQHPSMTPDQHLAMTDMLILNAVADHLKDVRRDMLAVTSNL